MQERKITEALWDPTQVITLFKEHPFVQKCLVILLVYITKIEVEVGIAATAHSSYNAV